MTTREPTVFVVDDDLAMRESLCWLISSVNLPVEAFSSAREFLDVLQPDQAGCAVIDVRMPGMSGLELQEALAARFDSIARSSSASRRYGRVTSFARCAGWRNMRKLVAQVIQSVFRPLAFDQLVLEHLDRSGHGADLVPTVQARHLDAIVTGGQIGHCATDGPREFGHWPCHRTAHEIREKNTYHNNRTNYRQRYQVQILF